MRLMRTPSVGWDGVSEHHLKEQIKNDNANPGDIARRCRLPSEPSQIILQRRSLVPTAEHQELACLLSTKMPPLNRLSRLRFAVAPSCVSAGPGGVTYS